MTDQTPALTPDEFRRKRVTAGVRRLLSMLLDPPKDEGDRAVCYLRVCVDLTESERELLLDVMLGSFPADEAERIVKEHFAGAGFPVLEKYGEPIHDARLWAADANSGELKAYAMACVERMSPKLVTAFRKWLASR